MQVLFKSTNCIFNSVKCCTASRVPKLGIARSLQDTQGSGIKLSLYYDRLQKLNMNTCHVVSPCNMIINLAFVDI